jgi:hypothetical protein
MSRTTYARDIEIQSARFGLDALLVEALIVVESGGHPYAFKPEPGYRWLYNVQTRAPFRRCTAEELARAAAPEDFPTIAGHRDAEWQGQRTSWGLMQIMGAVARERGYRHPYLDELTRIEANLATGCAHLHALFVKAEGVDVVALAAWNAGWGGIDSDAGINYAGKVLRARESLVTDTRRP